LSIAFATSWSQGNSQADQLPTIMIKNASATVMSTWPWQDLVAIRQRYGFLRTSRTHK
jgi:hypothetical protein